MVMLTSRFLLACDGLIVVLVLSGCGGPAANTVTPPAETKYTRQSPEMQEFKKNYGGTPANQEEINRAIEAAKKQAN